jgi:minor histocompatibility antigen H13
MSKVPSGEKQREDKQREDLQLLQIWGGHAASIIIGEVMFDWCAGTSHGNGFARPPPAAFSERGIASNPTQTPLFFSAFNMSEQDPGVMAQFLGRIAFEFAQVQPMLPMYLHLIVSALFPIYTGAHASLSRPSSAAKPPKKKRASGEATAAGHGHVDDEDDDEEEDEEEDERIMEGLSPTDALLMPLFAGCALASLYFLLKWMKDPALLNKILNAYFAIFGVFSVSRLVTDMLDIGHSIIFPHRYALAGALYHVNSVGEKAEPVAGSVTDKSPIASPLPGFLARLPLSARMGKMLWADRAMPGKKWTLRLYLHRVLASRFKVGPHGIFGVMAGLCTVAYFNLVDKPWYLTNLLGFGFSYGALQLMSPTTFATGSLILGALFFYDIYFVFYT